MSKLIILSALVASVLSADIHRVLENQGLPDIPEAVETHPIYKKARSDDHHPVYKADKTEAKEKVEPGRGMGAIAKHDMLADEPAPGVMTEPQNNENIPATSYPNPAEVAYPDIPYAPGYNYGNAYAAHGYDLYGNNLGDYLFEPDTSSVGLLWSQVPDSRTMVSYVGRTISWVFSSIFVLMLGSLLTVGVCSYTNLCAITFNGVGPIHEEMRSLITPERLEKISTAADFVKTAINKYQKIQQVTDNVGARRRRSL
ncbi:uncharacterized protein LOC119839151 [Zerene cesonia]|uniref:uncharacterized protein LOC119839151 n=1 Tax=Zerene cesonia TaxID=33412 RepID=UPI0018E5A20F|nr:uncharacterized protein LOC119839151 [Zerene cesonia]